jgi:hypothetical protein
VYNFANKDQDKMFLICKVTGQTASHYYKILNTKETTSHVNDDYTVSDNRIWLIILTERQTVIQFSIHTYI